MADNILLVTYSGRTVTPQDDALVYEAAVSQSGIIYGGEVTFKNSNTLHIGAGHGIICGRKFTIIESDISIQLTTGAVNMGRLYVHLDLSNTTAPIQIMTEIGTTLTAPIQQEDVNIINGVYEFNMATFTVDAQTVSSVMSVAPEIKSYPVLTAEEFESGSSDRGYLVDASDVLAKFKAQAKSIEDIETAFQDGCRVFVEDLTTNHGVEGIDSTSSPADIVAAYNGLIGSSGGGNIILACGLMGYINNRYAASANTDYVTKKSDDEYTAVKDFDAVFLSDFGIRDSGAGTYKLYAKVNGTNVLEHTGSSSAKLNTKSVVYSVKAGDVITFSITSVSNSAGSVMCYAFE